MVLYLHRGSSLDKLHKAISEFPGRQATEASFCLHKPRHKGLMTVYDDRSNAVVTLGSTLSVFLNIKSQPGDEKHELA